MCDAPLRRNGPEAKESGYTGRLVPILLLVGLAGLLIAALWRPLPTHGKGTSPERSDSALFGAVITRVAAGDSYYRAMNDELRRRGYPTASVFNWRSPLLIVALAKAPTLMRLTLILLIGATVLGTIWFCWTFPPEGMLLAVLAQIGASMTAVTPLGMPLPEPWSGLLIALSAIVYERGWRAAGAALALVALFVRELAAPYVAVCALIAISNRNKREVIILTCGLLAWCVYYLLHVGAAGNWIRAGDLAHPSWLRVGGLRFVSATIGFGGWLYLLPRWISAIALVLLAASWFAPRSAPHIKLAVVAYLVFFALVGQSFNQSWGLVTAPLWALGFALGASGISRLIGEALHPSGRPRATPGTSSALI